jgi:hypothetical protein
MVSKRRTILLGLVFLVCLGISYIENLIFIHNFGSVFLNPIVAILLIFIHNVLVVSLILLAMTFYVELVLSFFQPRRLNYVVLQHPRLFAFVFTIMIILLSLFRTNAIVFGNFILIRLAIIILVSIPNALIEGYGIYLTIKQTLGRTMTTRKLVIIYTMFFIAALVEVGFTWLLLSISA